MGFKLTCKESHRLISEAMDRELSLMERTRLRAHVMLCDACHNFNGQMHLIRQAMSRLDSTHQPKGRSLDDTWS